MPKFLATLALTASLSLLAGAARADVYMLEVLQLRPGVSAHHADSYLGALNLLARRHGGVRVSPPATSVGSSSLPAAVATRMGDGASGLRGSDQAASWRSPSMYWSARGAS